MVKTVHLAPKTVYLVPKTVDLAHPDRQTGREYYHTITFQ